MQNTNVVIGEERCTLWKLADIVSEDGEPTISPGSVLEFTNTGLEL